MIFCHQYAAAAAAETDQTVTWLAAVGAGWLTWCSPTWRPSGSRGSCGSHIREMRKHAAWYTAGYKNSAKLRAKICEIETYDQMRELFEQISQRKV